MNPFNQAAKALAAVARPAGQAFKYGTAGFRMRAELLDSTVMRVGVLAALRSAQVGQAVGVMVTASHNPVADNGLKIVEPDGSMLVASWEQHAITLANTGDSEEELEAAIRGIAVAESVDPSKLSPARVHVACDTRPSSAKLVGLLSAGVEAAGGQVHDWGELTTPQLHHIVRYSNSPDPAHRELASAEGYLELLVKSFGEVLEEPASAQSPAAPAASPAPRVVVDAANGVGGRHTRVLAGLMKGHALQIDVVNEGDLEHLNEGCGAEHCQKQRLPPAGVSAGDHAGVRLCSLDGDADRIVYHYFPAQATDAEGDGDAAAAAGGAGGGSWRLLDGDAIAVLAATWICEKLRSSGFAVVGAATDDPTSLAVGVVQTAYANGSSTKYLTEVVGVPVAVAKTGVKYLHHVALGFDVGVYFEANGHGTVLFSERAQRLIAARCVAGGATSEEQRCARQLLAATRLINQAVGDALSDMLFVEAVLREKRWGVADWDALYSDLPSRQTKLPVQDRAAIKTTPDEARVLEPTELQSRIDALVAGTDQGRAFVRPSGTEDVVRVYAEAASEELANGLALEVAQAAFDVAGGRGDRPTTV